MLKKIVISDKIVTILKALYHDTECAVVIENGISEWFRVDVGCLLSPTLFNVFLEFVMMYLRSLDHTITYAMDMSIDIR